MGESERIDSYANNSTVQNDILSMTKPFTEQALEEFFNSRGTLEGKIGIADLGCSSGPNALAAVSHMIQVVYATWRRKGGNSPELAVFLNDLPGNDFNNVFASLPGFFAKLSDPEFGPCLVFGAPGCFQHKVCTLFTLPLACIGFLRYMALPHKKTYNHLFRIFWRHRLINLPRGLDPKTRPAVNKGKINISKNSSKNVVQAYVEQFASDFTSFLESRSMEVVGGGRMVLSFMGRVSIDPIEEEDSYLQWELIALSLMTMVSEGIVEEEKVDSFNTPYYAASPQEIKRLVQSQGFFEIHDLQPFEINWDGRHELDEEDINGSSKLTRGEKIARIHRAVVEPILEYHFGESMMDELFRRYSMMLDSYLSVREPKFINLIITLIRKPL